MIPKIDESFHPDISMKNLYYIYLALGVIGSCLSWMIPIIIASFLLLPLNYSLIITVCFLLPVLIVVLFIIFWIPKYYSSIRYALTSSEVIVEKGVYWKRKSFVPYNRITNINIVQGPLARRFQIGTIKIQTAGFSVGGGVGHVAEAVILNVKNFDELKGIIMNYVRKIKPMAVEAEVEAVYPESINQKILNELRKIREALEKD